MLLRFRLYYIVEINDGARRMVQKLSNTNFERESLCAETVNNLDSNGSPRILRTAVWF